MQRGGTVNDNQHYQNAKEALGYLEDSRGSYVDPTTQALTTAQIEATLALAFEQRTANLVALNTWMSDRGYVSKPLAQLLDERLGFTGTVEAAE